MISLVVEHLTTADMPDGQALPPFMDDNAVWHVVRRADGRTHWRRISLNNPLVADWRTASGD